MLAPPLPKNSLYPPVQLWAVWFTLLVSLSGAALELFGGVLTVMGKVLSLIALVDLLILVAPAPVQTRWLPLTPYLYGGTLLTAWLTAFYWLYPSPLAHHFILLSALMLPALYIPCFTGRSLKQALLRAGSVLGLFLLLTVPHVLATAFGARPLDGFLSPLILLKTHGMMLALLAVNYVHVKKLSFMAHYDPLTGVANRWQAEAALEQVLRGTRSSDRPCAVLLLDIDHFKKVNDNHGHEVGDVVLRELARQLAGGLRVEDTLCRWGGEEFIVVVPASEAHEAWRLGERLRCIVTDTHVLEAYQVTVSVGVASARAGDSSVSLVARADQALYRAKRSGRNRTVMMQP